MTVKFLDLQEAPNPLNAAKIESAEELIKILEQLRARDAFIFELEQNNGHKLTVGLGDNIGFVQHSRSNGVPPYFLALAPDGKRCDAGSTPDQTDHEEHDVEFVCGNTPTPVPRRYCLPYEMVKQIAIYFLNTGDPSLTVSWDEI